MQDFSIQDQKNTNHKEEIVKLQIEKHIINKVKRHASGRRY